MVSRIRSEESAPEGYSKMAKYYDAVYKSFVDYPSLARFLEKAFVKHLGRRPRSILDIACGTGNYTLVFAERGYQTTGIDISDEMLKVARRKAVGRRNPKFLKMDMRKIRLPSRYDVATVLFGGFGYLLDEKDVSQFFGSAFKHLKADGLLVFEFWQNSAIRPSATRSGGERTWDRVESDDKTIIRLNLSKYDPHTNIHNANFDLYVLDKNSQKLLDSFSEEHKLKTYTISQMRELLARNRLNALAFYDGDLGGAEKKLSSASFSTFRVLAVAGPSK